MPRPHLLQRTFLHLDRLENTNSCDLVSLGGRLDPDRLRGALDAATARHPLARSRLGAEGWVPEAPPIGLELAPVDDDSLDAVLDAAAAHTWGRRTDLAAEAPVRGVLLRGPARDHLCLIGPHAATDARSGARLAEDVAQAYSALEAGLPPLRPVVPAVEPPQPTARDLLRALVELVRDVFTPGAGLSAVAAPRSRPVVRVRDLGAPLLAGLRAAARARGVTVHTLVLLALHRARARREAGGPLEGTPLRLLDLVSLRPSIPESDDAWDVLVAPHTLTLPAEPEAVLPAVRARLGALKAEGGAPELARLAVYDALAGWLPTRLAAALVFRFVTRTNLVLTNPGPVPWPVARFGAVPVVEMVSFPALMPPARVGLSLTTWRDRLRIVVLHDPAAFPAGVDDLVDPFVAELAEAARGADRPAA